MEEEEGSTVKVRDFSANILGETIHFHVISLQQSLLLWVGTRPSLNTLAVAMQTRFYTCICKGHKKCGSTLYHYYPHPKDLDEYPLSLQLLGESTNPSSSNLAKRIAKKTKCQCFASVNVTDQTLYSAVEQHIIQLIDEDPRTFYS